MLVGGRALQGLGAALVSPAALSIVTTTFAEGAERTKALGVWSAIAAGGGAVGLVLGGLLTETLSWRWVFFINLPIGIAAALLSLRFDPELARGEQARDGDVAGAVTVTGGLLVLVYAHRQGAGLRLGLAARRSASASSRAALLAAFVVIELRSKAPLIRLGIFRMRSLTASNIAMLFVASGLFAMFYFAGIYLQEILGYSPLKAGLAFLPFTFGIVIGAIASQTADQANRDPRRRLRRPDARARSGSLYFTQLTTTSTYLADVFPSDRRDVDRHGHDVRAADAARDDERRRGRRRPRIGAVQHVAADRRRARARGPLDARGLAHVAPPAAPGPASATR